MGPLNKVVVQTGVLEITAEGEILRCRECLNNFCFTTGEQEFYKEKGFTNRPSRCKECRLKLKNARNNISGTRNINNAPAWMKDSDDRNNNFESQNYRRDNANRNSDNNSFNKYRRSNGVYMDEKELHRRRKIRLDAPLPKI